MKIQILTHNYYYCEKEGQKHLMVAIPYSYFLTKNLFVCDNNCLKSVFNLFENK